MIVFLILFNCTTSAILKRKFGQCIPISLLAMTLLLYYTQFAFGTFIIGMVALVLWAALFIPLVVIKKPLNIKNYVFSDGLICFVIICVFFIIIDYGRSFSLWDELSHWGMMTKEMLRLDGWYSSEESRLLVHKDYPPFVTIFEMLWCRLTGGYSEMKVYVALHVFMSSFILPPLIDSCKIRNARDYGKYTGFLLRVLLVLISILVFISIVVFFDAGNEFLTIYKDIVIATIFAYAMMQIIYDSAFRDNLSFVGLLLSCASILVTKQIGIAFYLIILFSYFIMYFFSKENRKIQKTTSFFMHFFTMIFLPIVTLLFWKNYITGLGLSSQFGMDKISLGELRVIIGEDYSESIRKQTLIKYISSLLFTNISSSLIKISYVAFLIIILMIALIAYKVNTQSFCRRKTVLLGTAFLCGTIGYALTVGILYLFCFSETEMQNLASYNRYMSSYALAETLVIFCIFYRVIVEKPLILVPLFLVTLICNNSAISEYTLGIFCQNNNMEYESIAKKIEKYTSANDSVFILSADTIKTQYFVNFYSDDIRVSLCYDDILNDDFSNQEVFNTITNEIFENDYLFIKDTNDAFNKYYAVYDNGNDYQSNTLYRVIRDYEEISLVKID